MPLEKSLLTFPWLKYDRSGIAQSPSVGASEPRGLTGSAAISNGDDRHESTYLQILNTGKLNRQGTIGNKLSSGGVLFFGVGTAGMESHISPD